MTESLLNYRVENAEQYATQGDMNSMTKQSGDGWTFLTKEESAEFILRLTEPAIVKTCTIKANNTHSIRVTLRGKHNMTFHSTKSIFAANQTSKIFKFDEDQVAESIKITLQNDREVSLQMGLKHLILKGFKDTKQKEFQSMKKQKAGMKLKYGDPKQNFFQDPKKSPHNPMKKEENKTIFSRKTDKNSYEEDIQLKKAIQQINQKEKRQQKQKKQGQKLSKIREEPMDIENSNTINLIEENTRRYKTFDYEQNSKIFSFVNQNWVEAQRKAEIERNVQSNESIAKRIIVKHLYNTSICIDVGYAKEKSTFQKLAQDLGARIHDDPVDYCLLVTKNSDSDKSKKAKKLKGVKIISEQFLKECKQFNAKLDPNDYYIKL